MYRAHVFGEKQLMTHLFRARLSCGTIDPGPIIQETFVRTTYSFGIYNCLGPIDGKKAEVKSKKGRSYH